MAGSNTETMSSSMTRATKKIGPHQTCGPKMPKTVVCTTSGTVCSVSPAATQTPEVRNATTDILDYGFS